MGSGGCVPRSQGRKLIPPDLLPEEIVYDIPEDENVCAVAAWYSFSLERREDFSIKSAEVLVIWERRKT